MSARGVIAKHWPGLPERLDRAARNAGPAWLVGGFVRDMMLGRYADDLDLVCEDPEAWAAELGRKGKVVVMDAVRGHRRVVAARLPRNGLDLAPLNGPDIAADLAARDLTVNAMALRWPDLDLVDPLNGAADLAEKRLRATSEESLRADYLRALRVHRFGAVLGFTVADDLRALAAEMLPELTGRVAPERIRKEWIALLLSDGAGPWLVNHPELRFLWGDLPQPAWRQACERFAATLAPTETAPNRHLLLRSWHIGEIPPAAALQSLLLAAFHLAGGARLDEGLRERRASRREMKLAGWACETVHEAAALITPESTAERPADPLDLARFLTRARAGAGPALTAAHAESPLLEPLLGLALALCRDAWGASPFDPANPLAEPVPAVRGNDLLELGASDPRAFKPLLARLYAEQWAGLLPDRETALTRARALLGAGAPADRNSSVGGE